MTYFIQLSYLIFPSVAILVPFPPPLVLNRLVHCLLAPHVLRYHHMEPYIITTEFIGSIYHYSRCLIRVQVSLPLYSLLYCASETAAQLSL